MTRLSYTRALDNLLLPLGFERQKNMWTRVSGDIVEQLNLQKSSVDGSVTVNLFAKDRETERIIKTIPCKHPLWIIQYGVRFPQLIEGSDGRDLWWKNNPEGPAEVAGLAQRYALPWFASVTTVEDQAREWYGRSTRNTWKEPNLAAIVVTLYRLGELDAALPLFDEPIPRTANPVMVEKARCIQSWVKAQIQLRDGGQG
ncbi:DUF4304 domain-containing protein [Phenylobacterium sp.]|jgi:hypothetical protein|uniref:DUF4304 domain-containing protein n=1 Tax=Phenylobacterium sp. TaxID=1871053 RepID=UPI0037CAA87D